MCASGGAHGRMSFATGLSWATRLIWKRNIIIAGLLIPNKNMTDLILGLAEGVIATLLNGERDFADKEITKGYDVTPAVSELEELIEDESVIFEYDTNLCDE